MTIVSIHEAKTQLSRLIQKVLAGEEVVIARNKEPVARLIPAAPRMKRVPGRLKGKIVIDDRFFEPLSDDELAAWEGR
jgi:prevent-host-death family protein